MRAVRGRTVALTLTLSLTIAACGQQPTAAEARSEGAPQAAAAQASSPTHLFLDASASMAGYVRPEFASKPIGDLVLLLQGGLAGAKPTAWCFGEAVAAIKGDPSRFGLPPAYEGKGAPGCGNQVSRIDQALQAAQAKSDGALSLIVTDLWLDAPSMAAAPAVALGAPLQAMLKDGRAVAVIGVRSRFQGPVFGVPGVGTFKGASERPLFVLAIGPAARVQAFAAALTESGSPSFAPDKVRMALFRGASAPFPAPPPAAQGGGVSPGAPARPGVAAFAMDRRLAERQGGRIAGFYDAAQGLPAGTVWQGPLATRARVWAQRPGSWQPLGASPPTWKPMTATGAAFAFAPATIGALPPGRTYWVVGEIGSAAPASPNPATAWMREWSLAPGEKPGAFTKALDLASFAAILENADRVAAPGFRPVRGFQFTVELR